MTDIQWRPWYTPERARSNDLAGQWRRQLWGTLTHAPLDFKIWEPTIQVLCEISWCRCQQLTALSISTALVTKLLVIEQLMQHPAPKFTVSAPWHNFHLCPSSQQILATPLWLEDLPPWLRPAYCFASVTVWTENKNFTISDRWPFYLFYFDSETISAALVAFVFWGRRLKKVVNFLMKKVHPGDLAWGCSDLEMTWLLCCAGAATDDIKIYKNRSLSRNNLTGSLKAVNTGLWYGDSGLWWKKCIYYEYIVQSTRI